MQHSASQKRQTSDRLNELNNETGAEKIEQIGLSVQIRATVNYL